jgi:hypothetical protein
LRRLSILRRLFRLSPGLHLWLGGALFCLALFALTRDSIALMTAWTRHAARPLRAALALVFDPLPFSLGEFLALGAMAALPFAVTLVLYFALRRQLRSAYRAFLALLCAVLTVASGFCLFWGAEYYVNGFSQQADLTAEPVSVERLYAVTALFAEKASAAAQAVPRDETGGFSVPPAQILSSSGDVYQTLAGQYPFLQAESAPPKALFFSRLLSHMNYTGFYFPFTGEANVNDESPGPLLASTCAHELAHKMGFALEQECNLLAILSCTADEDPVFAYSGWLLGYVHLGNALYEASPELLRDLQQTLSPELLRDMRDNNAYWAQFTGPAARAADTVYDGFLKSYGNEEGLRSYGLVADLLVAYYS